MAETPRTSSVGVRGASRRAGFSSYFSGCIRYNRVQGQPQLSSTASSFTVGNVALLGGTVYTENPDGTFSASAGVVTYFNCAAFVDPNAPTLVAARGYAFGHLARVIGEVRSQAYANEDFSIVKRTALSESHSIIFKAEFVNAFRQASHGCRVLGSAFSEKLWGHPGNATVSLREDKHAKQYTGNRKYCARLTVCSRATNGNRVGPSGL